MELPVLAQMRSVDRVRKCLLFGVDRTYCGRHETDAFDPKQTLRTRVVSGLQFPLMELHASSSVIAEVVHGYARWRECEGIERFGQHRLQIILGGDADANVRIEFLAGRIRDEGLNVFHQ